MKGYRIKTVSRVTGLSAEVLRAWERRHAVVRPRRTAGGYREYSEEDVERLRLLGQLTAKGFSIGEIAPLATDELGRMARAEQPVPRPTKAGPRGSHSTVVAHLASLAGSGDVFGFRRALGRALAFLPRAVVTREVLGPLLDDLSAGTGPGGALPLAAAEVAAHLGPLTGDASPGAPVALVASAPGDGLSPGLVRAAVCCLGRGWQIALDGGSPRIDDIAGRAASMGVSATVLCFERAPDAPALVVLADDWGARGDAVGALVVFGTAPSAAQVTPPLRHLHLAGDPADLRARLDGLRGDPVEDGGG